MKCFLTIIILTLTSCIYRHSLEERKLFQNNFNNTQSAVTKWIKEHAMYPESYYSVSFEEYSESWEKNGSVKVPNSECYKIKHSHKLLNKDSILETFDGYFIMDNNFVMNTIEIEKSNSFCGAFPPEIRVWTDKFERLLNSQDSMEMKEYEKAKTKRILQDVKEGLIRGQVYSSDSNAVKKLRRYIDSVENIK